MFMLVDFAIENTLVVVPLAVAAAIAARCVRRPALVHALWLLVLLKLLTPPLLRPQWLPAEGRPRASEAIGMPAQPEPIPIAQADDGAIVAEGLPVLGAIEGAERPLEETSPECDVLVPVNADAGPALAWDWRMIALGVWGMGSLGVLFLVVRRVARLILLLRDAPAAPESLSDEVARLGVSIGLNRAPRVALSPGGFTPFVWALGPWSMLVLPSALWHRLNEEQRAVLVLHELAHLRRGDPWVRWVEVLATCLYWWHPALWIARRGLHQAEEQCCDAWVVWARPEGARTYASALVDALEFLAESRGAPRVVPIGASGLGRLGHISRRITMIMNGNVPRRMSWSGLMCVAAWAVIVLPCLPSRAAPREQEKTSVSVSPATELPADDDLVNSTRDKVERGEAQFRVKKEEVQKAKAQLEQAQANLARYRRYFRQNSNSVSAEEIEASAATVKTAGANLALAQAELDEARLRLAQASRLLARLTQQGEPTKQQDEVKPQVPAETLRSTAARVRAMNNLKQVGIALHNFADTHNNRFPAVAIRDQDGAPLLSWRVAILPYLEQDALYREFHLDEPWDSEHNKALIAKMPKVFGDSRDGKTAVAGWGSPGSLFDPARPDGLKFTQILDGTSNTIMAVIGSERPWTQPDEGPSLPLMANPFLALFCDGSVRWIDSPDHHTFAALMTVNGGEVIDQARLTPARNEPRPQPEAGLFSMLMQGGGAREREIRSLEQSQLRIAELEATIAALRAEVAALKEQVKKP